MRISFFLILILFNLSCIAQTNEEKAVDFIAMAKAAKEGDLATVQLLLKKGINPNGYVFKETPTKATYFSQMTNRPIQNASENGYFDIVKLLLQQNADPNWCCCSCVTALHLAILNKNANIVNTLLKNGADPIIIFDGQMDSFALSNKIGDKRIIDILKAYRKTKEKN